MTHDQRSELRRLQAAATALPWCKDYQPQGPCGAKCYRDLILSPKTGDVIAARPNAGFRGPGRAERDAEMADAAYLVAAANAVPALLDELEAAEADLHSCPTCGAKCKECRCMEAKLAAAEARVLQAEKQLAAIVGGDEFYRDTPGGQRSRCSLLSNPRAEAAEARVAKYQAALEYIAGKGCTIPGTWQQMATEMVKIAATALEE